MPARVWLEANILAAEAPLDGPASRDFVLDWPKRQFEGGWAGLTWPAEYGGRALSVAEQIVWTARRAAIGIGAPPRFPFQ